MEPILTIAIGVTIGILGAAGILLATYRFNGQLLAWSIGLAQTLWRIKWWLTAAVGIAALGFLYNEIQAEERRQAIQRLHEKELEQARLHHEERRRRIRAECDAERKLLQDQCQPIIAAAEQAKRRDKLLVFDKDLFDCKHKMREPPRPDCWFP